MRQPWRSLALVLLLVVSVAGCYLSPPEVRPGPTPAPPVLLLAVLDVGQADSLFLRSPAGRTMLVDAGNERADAEKRILPYMRKQGTSSLDYLVLTHPDQDHVGGMPAVLDGTKVSNFVDSAQPRVTNHAYSQTLERVRATGVRAIKARRGATDIDLGAGTAVQVLGPEDPLLKGEAASNNNGVALRITFGTISILLAADLEREAEERILGHAQDLRSQILKVAHHGSQGSSSNEFLDAVQPQVALISVGAGNSFGHPHRQTLQRLEAQNARVYRTDRQGTIEVFVDGVNMPSGVFTGYRVATEK